ncbi:MAG: HD domain-containing phosphohydrolase [Candidatus Aminicenantaceae bacterium]
MTEILIVDDDAPILNLLKQIAERNGHHCTLASSTEEARDILKKKNFHLVLSDIGMPGESGLDLIRFVLAQYPETAAVMVTGVDDPVVAELALEIGVYDYIAKPFEKNAVLISIANALRRRKLEIENQRYRTHLEKIVEEKTLSLKKTLLKLEKALKGTIQAIALTVEMRDPYTSGHQKRVADLSGAIAREMGMKKQIIQGIIMSGNVHDLGKISIPSEILTKPSQLNPHELSLIQTHPRTGYEILAPVEFPWPIAEIILQHHERMDGSGYPQGLSGDEILLEARILAVSDVVEAMSCHRPYRPALGIDKALDEIKRNRGILYDPDVVDACLKMFARKGFNLKLFPGIEIESE